MKKRRDKEKGFGLLGVVDRGKVNIQGKFMEDRGDFSKVCLCRTIRILTFCLQ